MPVGMNRSLRPAKPTRRTVPHACGDEPVFIASALGISTLFPMPVGMNRNRQALDSSLFPVPHACGDEPAAIECPIILVNCSPCLWG